MSPVLDCGWVRLAGKMVDADADADLL